MGPQCIALQANIVVGIRGVPVQGAGHRSTKNSRRYCVSSVSAVRGIESVGFRDWGVGRDYNCIGAHTESVGSLHQRGIAASHIRSMSKAKDFSAIAFDSTDKTVNILQRME